MKKNKLWLPLLLLLVFGAMPAQAAEPEIDWDKAEVIVDRGVLFRDPEQVSLSAVSVTSTFGKTDTCYGDQLDNDLGEPYIARIIYDAMVKQMPRLYNNEAQSDTDEYGVKWHYVKVTCDLSGIVIEDVRNYIKVAKEAYNLDYPEMCHDGSEFWWSLEADGTGLRIGLTFDADTATREANLAAATDAFKTAYTSAVGSETRLEKYQYVHDYLCERLYYNTYVAELHPPIDGSLDKVIRDGHNAYGALVGGEVAKGDVVCEGYADAFQLLCKTVGLPCLAVPGEGIGSRESFTGNTNHIWNYIQTEDGNWYAVDATWDDVDSPKTDPVHVRTMTHQYFTNNRYFLPNGWSGVEGATDKKHDHAAYGDLSLAGKAWIFGFPPLESANPVAASSIPTKEITLQLNNNKFSDAMTVLAEYGYGTIWYRDIPNVNIVLTQNTVCSSLCTIKAGYTLSILTPAKGTAYFLTRDSTAPAYTGSLFEVSTGGTLNLFDVRLDGEKKSARAPLIVTAENSTLLLSNVTVTGNQGACGIRSSGSILVGDRCVVDGNFSVGTTPANIDLWGGAPIVVCAPLTTGSKIGVDAAAIGYCITPATNYAWTLADRAVFQADSSSQLLLFDTANAKIYCAKKDAGTTAASQKVQITYTQAPPSCIAGQSITLTNSSALSVNVYAAAYDANGKLLKIALPVAVTLAADGISTTYTLPPLGDTIARYQVFVLSGSSPVSEQMSLLAA